MNGKTHTRVEVFRRIDGLYDFRIVAAENGNTLCSSNQGYVHESDARKTAKRVVTAELHGPVYFTSTANSSGENMTETPIEPDEPDSYAPEPEDNGRDSAVDLPDDYTEPELDEEADQ